jgi:hypothetical protein
LKKGLIVDSSRKAEKTPAPPGILPDGLPPAD